MLNNITTNNTKYWILQIMGWCLLTALSLIVGQSNNQEALPIIEIIYGLIALCLTHVSRVKFYIKKWNVLSTEQLLPRVVIIIALQAVLLGTCYIILVRIFNNVLYTEITYKNILTFYISSIMVLSVWNLLYFTLKFVERNRKLVIERLQIESNMKTLEIKTLKSHLQPHFIFNALNSIRALVDEDPEHARQAITQLSNILRSSIKTDRVETMPLKNELEIVKDYLSLEKIRYEERLNVHYNINTDTLELPVPPMMLQTVVENAIKHGISAFVKGGEIIIKSFVLHHKHFIIVINTGQYSTNFVNPLSEGFGIESTKEWLNYLYGNDAYLTIKNIETNLVELCICMPIKN